MHRSDFGFLDAMFINCDISKYHIIVVNQTSEDKHLQSTSESITVINTLERGLSKSRNMAISKATKELVLITDDDVIFLENLDKSIVQTYNEIPNAEAIMFATQTTEGNPFRIYKTGLLSKRNLKPVLSIEISFKLSVLKSYQVSYDERFGLGAPFSDTENIHFLNALHQNNLNIYGSNIPIVIHEPTSSSDDVAADRLLYARGASFYKRFGVLGYWHIFKYCFFLLRKGFCSFSDLKTKLELMHKGVRDYKKSNITHA